MRRWAYSCLLFGLSSTVWAQQNPAPSSPPPSSSSSSSQHQDASGLSHDNSFPEDTPAQSAPANDTTKKRAPSMEPPRSDRVQVDDLGPAVGESSSKDTQVDLSPPADDAKGHPRSSTAVAAAEAEALSPGGISELRTWDPHKAAKDVEVTSISSARIIAPPKIATGRHCATRTTTRWPRSGWLCAWKSWEYGTTPAPSTRVI